MDKFKRLDATLPSDVRMALESIWDSEAEDEEAVIEAMRYTLFQGETERKEMAIDRRHAQWARQGEYYTLVGDTVPKLPPGFYDLSSSQGQLFLCPVQPRTDKILRFPHAAVDSVIEDIMAFWEREEIFAKFKLPFKRGILLYGPPGSGKTSALQLIARDVVERGGVVLMWNTYLFMQAYRHIRLVQPDTPLVVLMEDLDDILDGHHDSQVLNQLDGAESLHKVVFVATTNYPEKLGPRIINRPSRFDRRIKVSHPDETGRRMYIESLLEGSDLDIDVEMLVRDTHGMSLAHVKELFISTVLIGTPYSQALRALKEMHLESVSSVDDNREFEREYGGPYV
jgi:hypothetical protein